MNITLKIAVCEDEEQDARRLISLIEKSGVSTVLTRFESGGAFLASRPAGRFDLIFFDIYMGGITGVEAAKALRETDEDCGIVFTTTSEDHMPEAFDVGAIQYLVKPVKKDKLEQVLKKRVRSVESARRTCSVNAKGQRREIAFDSIYYIEVYNHNCLIHIGEGVVDTGSCMTIDDFLPLLPSPRFFRCHKSYIVNMSYVERVERDFVMKNGCTVYIRRGDVKKCAEALDRWRLMEAGAEV